MKSAQQNSFQGTRNMTTEYPMRVAEMQASLTFKFSADPATATKLANQMCRLLQKESVSAAVTLEFEKLPASVAGAG